MSRVINDGLLIINISGPPASGKTTLCRILASVLKKYGIKCLYVPLTGFHYMSFVYAITLITLTYLGYARCIYEEAVKRHKLNPYDVVPRYILNRHLNNTVYMFELISLFLKFLIIKFRIFLMRPKVILLNEGILNTAFYYIFFFYSRESILWRRLLQKLRILLHRLCGKARCLVVLLLPELNEEIRLWIKRGDIPRLEKAKNYIYIYRKLCPTILKVLTHSDVSIEIYSFNNASEALKSIGKLILFHSKQL